MTPEPVASLLREHFDVIPVAPGPTAAELRARAAAPEPASGRRRPPPWRSALLAVAAAAAAVVAVLAVAVLPGLGDHGSTGAAGPRVDDGVTLPRKLPGLSFLTAKVSQAPPGRAIAVFRQGAWGTRWGTTQVIVLGVDGRTYRRLDVAEERGNWAADGEWSAAPVLLAPDGLSAAVADPTRVTSTIDVVDLTTGQSHPYRLDPPAAVSPLAWSPTGRSLIYAVLDGPSEDGQGPAGLAVLDIDSGRSRRVSESLPDGVGSAAPTAGSKVIVAGDPPGCPMRVFDLTDGDGPRDLPAGSDCAGGARVVPAPADGTDPGGAREDRVVVEEQNERLRKTARLLDIADPDAALPEPVDIGSENWLVGWRPGGMLVTTSDGFVEIPTDGAPQRVLTRFSESGSGSVYDWQVAANLVPDAVVSRTGVDRGPWPWWWRITLSSVLVSVFLVWLIARRRRSRRAVVDASRMPD
ncbi:hypothetical protein AB0J74_15620 [Asanoa sp. NPDC049573]|uniref:hypothetical protein n=1 Tax=Asanoa sp. NPDC049573 TaxID=3155396 RepID=UPI003447F45F